MIRKRLRARWVRDISEGEVLFRSFRIVARDSWIDHFAHWHVATYGETNEGPWWLRPFCRFHCWCDDWRMTLLLRKPMTRAELLKLRERSMESQ